MENTNKNWYDKSYKLLLILPVILLLISVVYLYNFNKENGDFIHRDVSLTGGTSITIIDSNINIQELEAAFPEASIRALSELRSGDLIGVTIETKDSPESIVPQIEKYLGYELTADNSSVEFSGASISEGFYKQLRLTIVIAFLLMALVVFILFRTPIRSLSIIIAVVSDIIMTVFVIDLFGMQVSSAGIVALLMLIGYAVDVDILLTTRVFKDKEGSLNHRIFGAFKTGTTMTLTAIAAVGISLIFTYTYSETLAQMFTILLIGLCFDMFNCWITNASLLKWYMEAKKLE